MRNIRLNIEYDGSRYQGWSRLGKDESTNTISNKIIDVIRKMTDEEPELFCGMRTEAGVHAYGQVANFKTDCDLDVVEIQRYLNRYLPMDIAVTETRLVPERFHAQLNARAKIYVYRVTINSVPSVFDRKYAYHSFRRPDKSLMEKASRYLTGQHDFKNFSSSKQSKSTIKTLYKVEIYEDMEEMQITLVADDFLHNMQRLITGTLLDIGIGNRPAGVVKAILAGEAESSAPCDPKGMYLQEIIYE